MAPGQVRLVSSMHQSQRYPNYKMIEVVDDLRSIGLVWVGLWWPPLKCMIYDNRHYCASHERHGASNQMQFDCLFNNFLMVHVSKHQSSTLLTLCEGNRRWPMDSPHKWQVMQEVIPCHDATMNRSYCHLSTCHVLLWSTITCIYMCNKSFLNSYKEKKNSIIEIRN